MPALDEKTLPNVLVCKSCKKEIPEGEFKQIHHNSGTYKECICISCLYGHLSEDDSEDYTPLFELSEKPDFDE